ncbi:TIR domain-containing protein [Spirosoma validum]|uniref:Nucleotide-binding protein n=1 Tax=Spirosoma validum TaxID=2771355 RepID=A0A927AZQ9_9BACT|nr:TIR domain-containing protein [Spirosoma validum]MBD2752637.1 nucleotide-binding protein [Spirosoma validum]
MNQPSVFIGSSSEGLDVARNIKAQLKNEAEITIWQEGVFGLNSSYLESLANALENFDFAILVLTPDDMVESRNQSAQSPRDNVLFECGLFMGKLGRSRTFIVYDSDKPIKIPSDLAGISLATYQGQRRDNNLMAAVGEACDPIRTQITKLGSIKITIPPLWEPFTSNDTQFVLGRFSEFKSFEQSGLLGVGDAISYTEVSAFLKVMGHSSIRISYADRISGDSLGANLVLIGGPDANSITREVVSRIKTSLIFGDPNRHEVSFTDSITNTTYYPEYSRDYEEPISTDCGVIIKAENPFSPSNQVLILFGSYGYGTWAAAKLLTSRGFYNNSVISNGDYFECVFTTDIVRETPQMPKVKMLRNIIP